MTPTAKPSNTHQSPLELKGSVFTLTVLRLFDLDLPRVGEALATKLAQVPGFFDQAPVVIDLMSLPDRYNPAPLPDLLDLLRQHSLVPVAIRSEEPDTLAEARSLGVGVLPQGRSAGATPSSTSEPAKTTRPPGPNRIIDTPVRSGQQIYSQGDLTIMASVSAGAEVMAEGSIHIYGALRGRALAGVQGDERARIFCQQLAAELVSVAGIYTIAEDIPAQFHGRATQIALEKENLRIMALGT
ncbi:MAG: septum site-determining protein MinC [Pseudomonadota bacterium]|nr:septum site-determining protein MinC [Pseudomonadota bacterium]